MDTVVGSTGRESLYLDHVAVIGIMMMESL